MNFRPEDLLELLSRIESKVRSNSRNNPKLIASLTHERVPALNFVEKVSNALTKYKSLAKFTVSPDAWAEFEDYPLFPHDKEENRFDKAIMFACQKLHIDVTEISVYAVGFSEGIGGAMIPGKKDIFIRMNMSIDEAIYSLIHELVHVAQDIEGKSQEWGSSLVPVEERECNNEYEKLLRAQMGEAYYWSKIEVDARKRGEAIYTEFVEKFGGTPLWDLLTLQPVE